MTAVTIVVAQQSQLNVVRAGWSEASRIIGSGIGVTGDPSKVAALEPIAVAFKIDDLSVMDQTIDHRGGDGVITEHFTPPGERLVRTHDQARPFIS